MWQKLQNRIKDVDLDTWRLMDLIWRRTPEGGRNKLRVRVERYPYGAQVLENGVAYGGSGTPLPTDFLVDGQTPFGLILNDKKCEVTEWGWGNRGYRPLPQMILGRGDRVGLFEVQSYLAGQSSLTYSDWSITSGARVIETPLRLNVQTPHSHLERSDKFNSLEPAWNAVRGIGRKLKLAPDDPEPFIPKFEFLKGIAQTGLFSMNEWFVEIAYFSNDWFFTLAAISSEQNASRSVLKARIKIADEAWNRSSDIGGRTSSELAHLLFKLAESASKVRRPTDTARLFYFIERAYAIARGRRPGFAPATSDELGPFSFFAELLEEIRRAPVVLIPAFASQNQPDVYLSLLYFGLPATGIGDTQGSKVKDMIDTAFRMLNEETEKLPANPNMAREVGYRNELLGDYVIMRRLGEKKKRIYSTGISAQQIENVSDEEFFCAFDSRLTKKHLFTTGHFFAACAKIRSMETM